MKETLIAYLAGCLDSDGYFTICKDSWAVRAGRRPSPTYHELIGLKQVTEAVPLLLKKHFGGHFRLQGNAQYPNRKPLYFWQVQAVKAAEVARIMLPHLRIKKPQAKILLELRRHKDRLNLVHYYHRDRAKVAAQREAMKERIHILNGIGVSGIHHTRKHL